MRNKVIFAMLATFATIAGVFGVNPAASAAGPTPSPTPTPAGCSSCHGTNLVAAPAATTLTASTYTIDGGNIGVGVSWDRVYFPYLAAGHRTDVDMPAQTTSARYIWNGGGYCINIYYAAGGQWVFFGHWYSAGRAIVGPFAPERVWNIVAVPGIANC